MGMPSSHTTDTSVSTLKHRTPRYGPSVAAGQWWRLFASFCLHSSFAHLLSNMVLFAMLAAPLEHNYGPLRILLIFLAVSECLLYCFLNCTPYCSVLHAYP